MGGEILCFLQWWSPWIKRLLKDIGTGVLKRKLHISVWYIITFEVVAFWSYTLCPRLFPLMEAFLGFLFWYTEQIPKNWSYKKKTATYINSVYNQLRNSRLLTPHTLSSVVSINRKILGTLFGDSEQLPYCILLDFLDIMKSRSFQMGFDFWRVKRRKFWRIWCLSEVLGNMVFVGRGGCCA